MFPEALFFTLLGASLVLSLSFGCLGTRSGFLLVPEHEARITLQMVLLLINSLGHMNLFLARYSMYYSNRDGNMSGLEAAEMVGGEGNLSILAHPSAKLATSSLS